MLRRKPRFAMIALLACPVLALSACTEQEAAEGDHYQPATLSAIPDSEVQRVMVTAEGARRLGLETAAVHATAGGAVLPYAALLYDAEGGAFTYTSPAPRTFVRRPVEIARIDGTRVLMSKGPAPGTKVVTTGAAEVLGAEFEVGH
jgi:uncharacterized iron-regulated membrane protein